MFREPEVTDSKAATKTDPSASARSTIRRQRTVRYPRASSHTSALTSQRSLSALVEADFEIPNHNADGTVQAQADRAHAEASNRLRLENGRALLRDAQSYERPGRRMRIPRNGALQPSRTRNYRLDGYSRPPLPVDGPMSRSGPYDRRLSPPRSIPTPPYTSGDVSNRSTPATNETTTPLGSASLTPRFAPAYRFDDLVNYTYQSPPSISESTLEVMLIPSASRMNGNETNSLRRVGHQSITESITQENARASRRAAARLDGLGDRDCSLSPEDASWDTLLTTIAPDVHLPSASSSFTSATASASSLSSNSASSLNTLVTPLSSTSENSEALIPICDMSDSEGSETEADDWDMEDEDESEDTPARNLEYGGTAARADRRSVDRLVDDTFRRAGFVDLRSSDPSTIEAHQISQMQSLVQALARRDDIPDEWWAATGLNRNLGGLELRVRELMERIDRLEVRRLEMERQRAALDERENTRDVADAEDRSTELMRERDRQRPASRRERRQRSRLMD